MAVSDRLPFPTLGTCRFMDVIATPTGSDPVLYRKGSQLYLANASLEQVAYIRKTGAYTLLASDHRVVAADTTTAAFTLALPASPSDGMEWTVFDGAAAGSWHTNNLTLSGNGKSIVIAGSAAAATVAFSSRSGSFVVRYHATSDRWHVTAQSASGAAPGAHAASHKAGGADDLLGAPGAIGGTTPAAGTFTTLQANAALTLGTDVSLAKEVDHTISVAASTTAATAGASLSILSANGNGAAGGDARLDTGTGTTGGTAKLGDANANAVTIGRTGKVATVAGTLSVAEGQTLAGTAPAAADDKVQLGVDDLSGATTAALKMINEGGGSLLMRMMSTAGAGKLAFYDQDVADDAEIALPTLGNGGFILVTASPEGGIMHLAADGTCTVIVGSTNFVNTDTDTKLCVYDAGANGSVKNRLGSSKRVTAILLGS